MGSAYIPKVETQVVQVGTVSPSIVGASPLIFIKLDSVVYTNGVRLTVSNGYRNIYGSYNSANGAVYLNSLTFSVSGTVPALTYSNVEVLLVG